MPPTYFAIFTTLGLQRLAEAQASDTPLVFTHVAVGDGGGAPITPSDSMTALVHETARVTVNNVEVSPDEPTTVRVEGRVPAATGGFTIREAALFNGAGEMIAIASYPPIYKPTPSEGATIDEYIRILLVYAAVEAIALTIDPNVIVATRLYVNEQIEPVARAVRGIYDDFVGTQVDLGKWLVNLGTPTVGADVSAGGYGALTLPATSSHTVQNVSTVNLPVGTNDFRLEARVRYLVANTSGTFTFGVIDGSGNGVAIRSTSNAHWHFDSDTADADLGVSPTTSYQVIVVERIGGQMKVTIDGALVYNAADSTDLGGGVAMIVQRLSSDCTLMFDYIAFAPDR